MDRRSASLPARRSAVLAACLLAGWLAAAPAGAAENSPPGWTLSLGAFDFLNDELSALEGGVEYRFRPFRLVGSEYLQPMLGVSATEEGSFWVYVGLRYDWELGERWVLTPNFAVSYYEEGDGKDLGGPVELRSGLELAYRFESGARLGLLFYHLSNSRIYELNPGSESLVLVYSFGG